MLKKRLIACLVMRGELIVQSIGFKRYLPIGKPAIAVEFMRNWDVDEILLIDMTASREGRPPNLAVVSQVSKTCFVPLTYGGGIRNVDQIRDVVRSGGDKVCLNSAALKNPDLIEAAALRFGNQCIVLSIDVKRRPDGGYAVYDHLQGRALGLDPVDWAKRAEALGAGEILLNSVDRDGSRQGYDVDLVRRLVDAVGLPVIALGGVGKMEHFVEGVREGRASAVAAANIFTHTEHSTIIAKAILKKAGVDIRLATAADYKDFAFDAQGRIVKKADAALENIWFNPGAASRP